ncbi:MAG TPA: hypothetical protein VE377_13025 [Candidatus Dormibacteraeota bacterium]|nr:hypothetical protein [Candidatus Dormibacteraeota bacterium]
MSKSTKTVVFGHLGLPLVILCFVAFPSMLLAGGKDHPMQGTVTALGTSQDTTGGGTTPVFTHVHRTYTVKTDARVFVLECPYDMEAIPIVAPRECGGKKKIAIGDAIHFRLEKNNAFVLTAQGKDERLRVVSEAMNEAGNTVPAASQQQ